MDLLYYLQSALPRALEENYAVIYILKHRNPQTLNFTVSLEFKYEDLTQVSQISGTTTTNISCASVTL